MLFPNERSPSWCIRVTIGLHLVWTIVACSGAPIPPASACRLSMGGRPREVIKACCERFGLGCQELLARPDVIHIDVGHPPSRKNSLSAPIRLGGTCGGADICRGSLECRDGVCRKNRSKGGMARSGDINVSLKQRAAPSRGGGGGSETGDPLASKDRGIQLSGLSVPISARIPVESVARGQVPFLPDVRQRLHKNVRVVTANEAGAPAVSATGPAPSEPHPGADSAGDGSNKTCADSSTAQTLTATGPDSAPASGVKGARPSAAGEETEDEQIVDSVAEIVEKFTGVTVDETLLKALDAAVTKTMDGYEDKALASGDLLIDVDELMSGKSSSVKIGLPATERVTGSDAGADEAHSAPLNPEDRVRQMGDQVRDAIRKKVKEDFSPDVVDKLATALMSSSHCTRTANKGATAAAAQAQAHGEPNCEVVRWIQANWLKHARPGGSRDGSPGAGGGEL
jgi:hypothetical protein